MAEEVDDFEEDFGSRMMGKRLAVNTKNQYQQKVKNLKAWLLLNHPAQIVDDQITLPLSSDQLIAYMSQVCHKANPKEGESPFNSFSTVSGYNSAVKWLYQESGVQMAPDATKKMSDFLLGYRRQVAEFKESGQMKMFEGKYPMTPLVYRFLAKKALEMDRDFHLSCTVHTFLLLAWNLISRSNTVEHLMFERVEWEEDSLVVSIGKMKNDQEGQNFTPRHVFANSEVPEICPILSLAILVFCKGYSAAEASRLLLGNNASSRSGLDSPDICFIQQ
jgi:hypothetical protein